MATTPHSLVTLAVVSPRMSIYLQEELWVKRRYRSMPTRRIDSMRNFKVMSREIKEKKGSSLTEEDFFRQGSLDISSWESHVYILYQALKVK